MFSYKYVLAGVSFWLSGLVHAVEADTSMDQPVTPVRIQGVIADGGVACLLMLTNDGTQFTLQGLEKHRYPAGTRFFLEGRFVRISKCMQGTKTFQVEQILTLEFPRQ